MVWFGVAVPDRDRVADRMGIERVSPTARRFETPHFRASPSTAADGFSAARAL